MLSIHNKTLLHCIRIFIGLVFIISSVFKLIGIDAFEIYIFSLQLFGLPFSSIIARLVISGEFILGILLIANIDFSLVKKITFAVLGVFSIFLLIQIISGKTENCFCFGEMIQLSPAESLIKNIVLLFLLWLIRNDSGFRIKYASSIQLFVIVFALLMPVLLSQPDFMLKWPQMSQDTLSIAAKRTANSQELQPLKPAEGKKMICMLSVTCGYCIHAANKISVIADKHQLNDEIIYVFAGDEAELPLFWEKSKSTHFNYTFLPFRSFFDIAGPSIPSIYLSENGEFKQQFNYRNIDEKAIADFFEK